jgi:hypothetical protein
MNERIRDLADNAIVAMPGAWNIPDEFCEKFAELIVRECAQFTDSDIRNFILNHFGVEQ